MSVMLDILGSFVLLGMLMLTVMSVNVNISTETYKSVSEFNTQSETIQLARILEFDIYKAGFNVPKPAIAIAETSRLKFYANLYNTPGRVDSIQYGLGELNGSSTNPYDKQLFRFENTAKVFINYSVTGFKFTYYDARDSMLTAPVTGTWRDSIRSIKVFLTLESPEPYDSKYAGAYYEKMIYPRNLQ